MNANILDKNGAETPIVMGSYGIGIGRIAACAIELAHDKDGILWPSSITPYDVVLIGLNLNEPDIVEQADILYTELQDLGFDVLYDDRELRPGFKFKDAEVVNFTTFRSN